MLSASARGVAPHCTPDACCAVCLCSCPHVAQLRLYDVANTAGVAADLSHINTAARITAHTGADQLPDALYGAHLVVIPAGVPRKPGMTRDDLFNINAGAAEGWRVGWAGGAVLASRVPFPPATAQGECCWWQEDYKDALALWG